MKRFLKFDVLQPMIISLRKVEYFIRYVIFIQESYFRVQQLLTKP